MQPSRRSRAPRRAAGPGRAPPEGRGHVVAALVAAALGVALVIALRRAAPPAADRTAPVQVAALDRAPTRAPGPAGDVRVAPPATRARADVDTSIVAGGLPRDLTEDELVQAAVARLAHTEAVYRETMQYPVWSRPADATTQHLIAWNQLAPRAQPFTRTPDARDLHGELQLDRMFAGPGEAITATVEVYVDEDGQRRGYPAQVQGEIQMVGPDDEWITVAAVPFVADGPRWTAKFEPAQVAELAAAPHDVQFVAWVTAADHTFPFESPFRYTAQPVFDVVGWAGDRIVDGSLAVDLDVDVKSKDPVRITAALYDATGAKAIAVFDDYVRPTALGRQSVRLTFFGRAIREAAVDGPYRIKALHGFIKLFDGDIAERFWQHPDDPSFVTRPYRATDFAGAALDDADTRAHLDQYQQLDHDLRTGGPR